MNRNWVGVLVGVSALLATANPAAAGTHRVHRHARYAHQGHRRPAVFVVPARMTPPETPPSGPYASALLIDADSGQVLFERAPETPRPPASMVKMMVALVAFEALEHGEVRLNQSVPVSLTASRTGGSGVLLKAGEILPFEDLLKAMLVASANGASVAIAEELAGSQQAMVERMNRRAHELGMSETVYRTVNGLPPRGRKGLPDITSAHDLAILARKLLEHRDVLRYCSQPVVPIRNGTVLIRNTNHLVGHMDGADGLKTGYYRRAGFNLTATASRNGLRLIAIVMGCPTVQARFHLAQELLEWGFANFAKTKVARGGEPSIEDGVASVVPAVSVDDRSTASVSGGF